MPKIPVIKAKDFFKFLVKYGCQEISIRGSHHKMFNPATRKTSVISIHSGQDINKGAFVGVLSQLGIDVSAFVDFIKVYQDKF